MTQREAIKEIHERVRQCFTRHRFAVYGDALSWWHKAIYETQVLESGEQGMPKFATDILWIIAQFGPKEPVDYNVMATRRVPALKSVAVLDPDEVETEEITDSPKTSRPSKKTRHRKRRF